MTAAVFLIAGSVTANAAPKNGWKTNTKTYSANITKDQRKAFRKATADKVGVSYKPIAVVGSQVVSGTNDAYLCLGKTMTKKAAADYYIVTIYTDLQNNPTLKHIEKINLSSVRTTGSDEQTPGGWTINQNLKKGKMPKAAKKAFSKATKGHVGYTAKPIAYLGMKAKNGKDYKYLCLGKTVTADPKTTLDVVTVHVTPKGSAKIKSIKEFNLAAYTG